MDINDKRKFTADGELKGDAKASDASQSVGANLSPSPGGKPSQPPTDFRKLLSDLPCTFEDPRPRRDHVLIRQHAAETTFAGTRFVIPEVARQSPNDGVVVAVGKDVDPAMDCKPGDLVTFGRFNAEPITIDGEDYQLVHVADIKLVREVTYAVARN